MFGPKIKVENSKRVSLRKNFNNYLKKKVKGKSKLKITN